MIPRLFEILFSKRVDTDIQGPLVYAKQSLDAEEPITEIILVRRSRVRIGETWVIINAYVARGAPVA